MPRNRAKTAYGGLGIVLAILPYPGPRSARHGPENGIAGHFLYAHAHAFHTGKKKPPDFRPGAGAG